MTRAFRTASALLALAVSLGLLLTALLLGGSALLSGCGGMQRIPTSSRDSTTVAATRAAWIDLGIRYPRDPCDAAIEWTSVDEDMSRCSDIACSDHRNRGAAIHVRPGLSPEQHLRDVVHETWHVLHRCSDIARDGDPFHASGLWESAGDSGALRIAQKRVQEFVR